MNYLQVKPTSDQTRTNPHKTDFLIANELYTFKEIAKKNLTPEFIQKHFISVITSKYNTYRFFGARFCNSLNQ